MNRFFVFVLKVNLLDFEKNPDRQDPRHPEKYSIRECRPVQCSQMLGDCKLCDKLFGSWNFFKENVEKLCLCLFEEKSNRFRWWKRKSAECGGIGFTFSTIFNSESRRGLKTEKTFSLKEKICFSLIFYWPRHRPFFIVRFVRRIFVKVLFFIRFFVNLKFRFFSFVQ